MQNIHGWIIAAAVFLLTFVITRLVRARKRSGYRLRLAFILNQIKIEGNNMALTMTTTQQATGQVQPVDSKGNPAQVQAGSVDYFIDDPDLVDVIEDPDDETKFTLVAKGKVGVGQFRVTADADLGEGVKSIETFAAIEILPAGAVGFGITFGTPTEQE